jgi:hypothetical protein
MWFTKRSPKSLVDSVKRHEQQLLEYSSACIVMCESVCGQIRSYLMSHSYNCENGPQPPQTFDDWSVRMMMMH